MPSFSRRETRELTDEQIRAAFILHGVTPCSTGVGNVFITRKQNGAPYYKTRFSTGWVPDISADRNRELLPPYDRSDAGKGESTRDILCELLEYIMLGG